MSYSTFAYIHVIYMFIKATYLLTWLWVPVPSVPMWLASGWPSGGGKAGQKGESTLGGTVQGAAFGGAKIWNSEILHPHLSVLFTVHTNAIVVTIRISIGDLIVGVGSATKTLAPPLGWPFVSSGLWNITQSLNTRLFDISQKKASENATVQRNVAVWTKLGWQLLQLFLGNCNKFALQYFMCFEVKFYYGTLVKGEWRAKHIREGEGYICWVTLHPQQSIQKWKDQQIKKDGGLQIEGECHKPAT